MIQIATVGDTQIVVKEGLRKTPPEKLYILHTENERTKKEFDEVIKKVKPKEKSFLKIQQYKDNAGKLRKEILDEFKIPVELVKVGKYDTYDVIREIQEIISKEKKKNLKLQGNDFAINITGGTKAMVAGAACSAYLAQTKMYYVLQYHEAKGKELVMELPVPPRVKSRNTISGSTESTTSRVLEKIWKLNPPVGRQKLLQNLQDEYGMPTEVLKSQKKKNAAGKYKKTGDYRKQTVFKSITPQTLNFHLNKLEDLRLIDRKRGTEKTVSGKTDRKSIIIDLTDFGRLRAAYPETIGDII